MKLKYTLGLAIISLSSQTIFSVTEPVLTYLKQSVLGSRHNTLAAAIRLAEERNVQTILETGTARGGTLAFSGDGGFTILLGYWCFLNNRNLYSVDISEHSLNGARTMVSQYEPNVHLIQDDSVNYIRNFDKVIDFLYLDSFDFDTHNPYPSQKHHLDEIIAAYDKLAPHSIVMIDDCGLPHGGKGKLVIEYLLSRGWYIYMQDYQVIMLRS